MGISTAHGDNNLNVEDAKVHGETILETETLSNSVLQSANVKINEA